MEIQQMQIAMVLSRKIVLILAAFKVMQKKDTERNWESEKKTTKFVFLFSWRISFLFEWNSPCEICHSN